ncbi:MAG TPA: hypothetical protein VJ484_14160, partial [Lysobacter sp.]|nr:hypothetical protein [Lysobacter sp.]
MSRGRTRRATLAMALIGLTTGSAHAARLEYVADLGVERNDNLNLSQANPLEDTIYRPGIGFSLTEDAEKFRGSAAGRVEYRHYADGVYDNGFVGDLAARGDWRVIPERLTFTIEDALAQAAIDTFEADNPDNQQQVNVLAIGSTVDFRMGSALDGQVELRYVDFNAEVTDEFNSGRVDLVLRTIRRIDETSQAAVNVRGQSVDFDDEGIGRNYRRGDLYASYERHLNHFNLELDIGYSHIGYTHGFDSRSEPLFRADITWIPDDSKFLSMEITSQFSDAATDTMERHEDVMIPGSILTSDTVINASPFNEERGVLSYTHTATLISASIDTYAHTLDYVESDEFDQEGYGVRGALLWIINPRTTVGVFGGFDHIDYLQLEREEEYLRYGVNFGHSFSRH